MKKETRANVVVGYTLAYIIILTVLATLGLLAAKFVVWLALLLF